MSIIVYRNINIYFIKYNYFCGNVTISKPKDNYYDTESEKADTETDMKKTKKKQIRLYPICIFMILLPVLY